MSGDFRGERRILAGRSERIRVRFSKQAKVLPGIFWIYHLILPVDNTDAVNFLPFVV